MKYSTTYAAVLVALLVHVLKFFGVVIGSEELTPVIVDLVTFLSGAWVLVERYRHGGVNVLGVRK